MASLIGHIGDDFVFQALFLDAVNQPIAATGVTIDVFRFDDTTGDKVLLVASIVMTPVNPSETGRFIYQYTIPTTLLDGDVLYAEMSGTDPGTSDRVLQRVQVNVVDPFRTGGMQHSFI
jgi:hypothetical protein